MSISGYRYEDRCTACGDGVWIEAGPRFRGDAGALGVDLLWVHGRDGKDAFGVRADAALGGKPGKGLAIATTVGLGLVGMFLVVVLVSTTT